MLEKFLGIPPQPMLAYIVLGFTIGVIALVVLLKKG